MMTRWLAYARLFDFDVRHVPGNKNGAADGLSRRGKAASDETDSDPDEYFKSRLYHVTVATPSDDVPTLYQAFRIYFNEDEYTGDDLILGRYLSALTCPDGLTDQEYQALRRKAKDFLVRDGFLFKRGSKRNVPPRRAIGLPKQRTEVIRDTHDEIGHPGQKATYDRIARCYQWKG